jgi:hypothetical protein
VRVCWWRALHPALLAVPVLQALLGRACFLTLWQAMLEQEAGARASQEPLARLVKSVIFWPLPIWFFVALYVAIWIYALVLWWPVPPTRPALSWRSTPPLAMYGGSATFLAVLPR